LAFFKKLKSKLFKSSSKIDEGLEAIIEDGGVVDAPETVDELPVDQVMDTPVAAVEALPEAVDEEPAPMPADTVDAPEPVSIPKAVEPAKPEPVQPKPVQLEPVSPEPAKPEPAKPGLMGRLMGRSTAAPVVRRVLDDEMLEQLEELLISTDMGVDTALRVTANMAEGRFGKRLSVEEIKRLLAAEIARIMDPIAKPLPLYAKTPQVVLVVGVNGSGKTTTIGKLASQFKAAGKHVMIAAGDTFRAAAVEQLQVWATVRACLS